MSSSCRRHASSPAMTPPLDVDDLLSEILLRLPPQPSSLPRASLVCRRWRQLVSDPGFFRRFRLHHRRNLPLLGVFVGLRAPTFLPTLEAPNRVPPERFSLQLGKDFDDSVCFGCRHGLLLIWVNNTQVLVWDPVTGDQHRIAIPAAFREKNSIMNGTVLRVARADQHFQVVLVIADIDEEEHEQAVARVYSSKTGSWGNLISTSLPCHAYAEAAVLVGGCLYWHLFSKFPKFKGILEFDLERQSLAVLQLPVDIDALAQGGVFNIMRAEGGGLGFFFLSRSDYTMQLWKRTTDCDGVASWGLAKTIELDKLLSLKPEEKEKLSELGFAKEKNVVFLKATMVVFMINLDSLKFEKLFETNTMDDTYYHAFESVYPAGALVAGGHDVAELLHKMILR